MTETYKVVRSFFNDSVYTDKVIETGLTLAEAKEHCNNPETSSRTCTEPELVALTQERGRWFDSYEEE